MTWGKFNVFFFYVLFDKRGGNNECDEELNILK